MIVSVAAARLADKIYVLLRAPLPLSGMRYVVQLEPDGDPMCLGVAEECTKWFPTWYERYHTLCVQPSTAITEAVRIRGFMRCLRELRMHRLIQSVNDIKNGRKKQ